MGFEKRTAWLFPGQGSQFVGMGKDLYDASPDARHIFESANEILGFSLTDIMFGQGGDEETESDMLRQTAVTQPALYVHSVAALCLVRKGESECRMAAGHSLGEYSALTAAGALKFEDGLRLVRLRGELMGRAGTHRPGTMAAIIGLDDEAVERICKEASSNNHVVRPANYNSPGQIVISGDVVAVEAAAEAARKAGARRAKLLPVSGAFHSPLMESALDGLSEGIQNVELTGPLFPVVLNVSAGPETDPEQIRQRLVEQLTAPVRWSRSLEVMKEAGIDRFVEIGAGRVLSGLVRRTLGRDTETVSAGTFEQIGKISTEE